MLKFLVYKMLILHSPPVLLPRKAQVVAKLASGRSASKSSRAFFQHTCNDGEKFLQVLVAQRTKLGKQGKVLNLLLEHSFGEKVAPNKIMYRLLLSIGKNY